LSPIVRAGRAFLGLLTILTAEGASTAGRGGGASFVPDYFVVGLAVVLGVISWYMTTWRVDGDSLQVASGLIRRRTIRVPLSRVQAVDLAEPLLARILGLAEVRVRTAGGKDGDARLMYLKLEEADRVRGGLLALVHGLPQTTPPPPERPLLRGSNRRLVASNLLTGAFLASVVALAIPVVLLSSGKVGAAVIGASGGTLVLDLFAVVSRMVRRVAGEWGFEVAEAPDGLRIRCGFASRVAETIPYGRVQAIRMLEPLWWRSLGWCRLELHLAGGVAKGRNQPRAAIRRALLPVGTRAEAEMLLGRILADHAITVTPPPRRAMWRAPLSYHFLAAGKNPSCAMSVGGRVCRLTEWIPMAKVQSIRYTQGPLQRALDLASVQLDVAGHRARAHWSHRSSKEANALMAVLPDECRVARDWEASTGSSAHGPGPMATAHLSPPPPA
jgi:putative membrane protein